MTARQDRPSIPGAVGVNRRRIETLEAVVPFTGADGSLRQTGWTIVFGDGTTPVVTGDYQAIWQVPREIVGDDGEQQWFIYDPSAYVHNYSTTIDVEIWLYRVRNGTSVSSLLDSPIVIDDHTYTSRLSATPPVVTQYANLVDFDGGPNYDAIMVGIDHAGTAEGLSISIPIGIEQPPGSGYHIP